MVIAVIPPDGTVNGKDLKFFIKKYWQAVCPIPKEDNPIWDNDGSKDESFNASINEDLFMLSPSMHPQTPLTRDIKVPSGKGLFIPVVPVEVSECETERPVDAIANQDQASIDRQSLIIELKEGSDVTPIDLDDYKFRPFDIGNVTFPAEAIFNIVSPLDSCKAVAAGRYVWTKPLQTGKTYQVHYGGRLRCAPPNPPQDCIEAKYSEDITYNITVR